MFFKNKQYIIHIERNKSYVIKCLNNPETFCMLHKYTFKLVY